jgi:hypothetical protein
MRISSRVKCLKQTQITAKQSSLSVPLKMLIEAVLNSPLKALRSTFDDAAVFLIKKSLKPVQCNFVVRWQMMVLDSISRTLACIEAEGNLHRVPMPRAILQTHLIGLIFSK